LSEEWKESITVPIYKKGDITACSNHGGTSLCSTTYKTLANILLSRLTPHAKKIIRDRRCAFRRSRSTADHIPCIPQILKRILEYNEAVHYLFIDFKKAYDSVRREVLYNILIEFGISMKQVSLIKMCQYEAIAESG
jgi:hypothetical protein